MKFIKHISLLWILVMVVNISSATEPPNKPVTSNPNKPISSNPKKTAVDMGHVAFLSKLQDIIIKNLSGDDVQITLKFSDLPRIPNSFTIDSPPELVLDFVDTVNNLPKDKIFQKLSLNLVKNISFATSGNKVRMIISLDSVLPFTTEVNDHNLVITIKNEVINSPAKTGDIYDIAALNFHRGDKGEGKLILDVAAKAMDVNFEPNNDTGEIIATFKNVTIAEHLLRRFDVSDFGTPLKFITIKKEKDNVVLTITALGEYDRASYHIGNKYIIEARSKLDAQQTSSESKRFKFTGEKISFNFQDIEVRAVLQLLADFTGLNMVASDSVQGNVTLRLDNVPWDQALDFILRSRGLNKRESGNVLLIAPSEELAKYEESELSSNKQLEALAPLRTEFLQINYAKAEDIVKMIKGTDKNSMLSEKGSVSVDSRTNLILIKDTEEKISDVKDLIKILDVPIRQVLIEAHIVTATENFQNNLGIKLSGAAIAKVGSRQFGFSNTGDKASNIIGTGATPLAAGTSPKLNSNIGQFYNLGSGGLATLGISVNRLPGGTLLNLEIDAAETELLSTTIAKPKVLTMDKQAATIESGQSIPYSSGGAAAIAASTQFQKVTLNLTVTPQITPNDQISMDLSISNDSISATQPANVTAGPAIDTNSLKTSILVNNGETIVLGGVLKDVLSDTRDKVPYLNKIPFLGALFRNKKLTDNKSEMLIFITPKIVQPIDKDKT